jgi:Sec-independent protein secretion pathway component TatC
MTNKTMDNPEKLVTYGTQDDDKQNNAIVMLVIVLCTHVSSFSGLSTVLLVIVLCTLYYQFLWIVHCFACLCNDDKQNNGQSRETGSIGYTKQ